MSTPNFTKPQDGKNQEGQANQTDETQPTTAVEGQEASGTTPPESELSTVDWLKKELEKTRKEAAAHRIAKRDAEQKLAAIERQKLEEQGQYQRLYEQAKSELEAKTIEIEAGSTYRTAFEETLRKRIEAIPEVNRGLIPNDYDPIRKSQWLDANWERLGARKFPNLDAGAGGSGGSSNTPPPDPVAQDLARKLGVKVEKLTQK